MADAHASAGRPDNPDWNARRDGSGGTTRDRHDHGAAATARGHDTRSARRCRNGQG